MMMIMVMVTIMVNICDDDCYLVMKVILVKEVMFCDVSPVAMFMINLMKCVLYRPWLLLGEKILKIFSPNKSSGAADFDCLLTMNDNCNEIDHCSVRMMMVIKNCNCNEIFGLMLICKRAGAGVGNLTGLAQSSII